MPGAAPGTIGTCVLLAALSCAACTRPPPPPPENKPEPQATQLRDAIRAPIDKAKAAEGAVQDAADRQKAAIDAAVGG